VARRTSSSPATRLARLEERLAEARRMRAGDAGPVVAYVDDDEQALAAHVAQSQAMGAEVVVVVRSLAPRPAGQPAPWA